MSNIGPLWSSCTCLQYKSFENTAGKGEIARCEHRFPTLFSTLLDNFLPFSSKLSSADIVLIWLIWWETVRKGRQHCKKRRNLLIMSIFSFSTMFSTLALSKLKAFADHTVNLTQMVQYFFNSLPNNKFLDWSILKAFADDRINVT